MKLRPVIASYTGESYQRIMATLDEQALETVSHIALTPRAEDQFPIALVQDLIEMHVLRREASYLKLNTGVFLAEDMELILAAARELGTQLAAIAQSYNHHFSSCSPELKNLLGTMLGINQGLSQALRTQGVALDWSAYPGRFARAKVDFDQICPALEALGPDLQNKTVLRGRRYTAVFIGSGAETYAQLVSGPNGFRNWALGTLTDSLAELIAGDHTDPALIAAAEDLSLAKKGRPKELLLTRPLFTHHQATISALAQETQDFYLGKLHLIQETLAKTTSGRQGVPPANMMMHFWRYCRRSLAQELYRSGFLTDSAPEQGSITLFYDNSLAEVSNLL